MPATPTGILLTSIGMTYDVGIGQNPFTGTTRMYGYMVASGTQYEEATDLQDDQHLVQVASPNASDKYGRYAKISQGRWDGGERQLIFEDPTRYYQSQKLETAIPGRLRILGYYRLPAIPATVGAILGDPGGIAVNAPSGDYFHAFQAGTGGNILSVDAVTGATTVYSIGTGNALEMVEGPDQIYASISNGIFAVMGGTRISTTTEIPRGSPTGRSMTYLNNAITYIQAATPDNIRQLLAVNAGFATPVAPVQMIALKVMEGVGYLLAPLFPTGYLIVQGALANYGGKLPLYLYSWDGTNSLTGTNLIAEIEGVPLDARLVGNVTYLLTMSTAGGFDSVPQPVIYAITGSNVSIFDDYRYKSAAFQNPSGMAAYGRIDGDGTYLYMSFPSIGTKRYDLTAQSLTVVDIGHPGLTGNFHRNVVLGENGSFGESNSDVAGFNGVSQVVWGTACAPNDTGYLITSYYDAGVPGVSKSWKSFQIELNAPLGAGASVGVQYRLDNTVAWTDLLPLVPVQDNQGNLIWYFPAGTKASRIQYKITLTASTAGVSPDIRSFSSFPTTGRVWRFTVWAFHTIQTHAGDDSQGATAGDLIANIMNIYNNGGKAILFVPDPTQASGVAQVNATLQDYTRRSKSPPGPRSDEFEPLDQGAELSLVFSEDL